MTMTSMTSLHIMCICLSSATKYVIFTPGMHAPYSHNALPATRGGSPQICARSPILLLLCKCHSYLKYGIQQAQADYLKNNMSSASGWGRDGWRHRCMKAHLLNRSFPKFPVVPEVNLFTYVLSDYGPHWGPQLPDPSDHQAVPPYFVG